MSEFWLLTRLRLGGSYTDAIQRQVGLQPRRRSTELDVQDISSLTCLVTRCSLSTFSSYITSHPLGPWLVLFTAELMPGGQSCFLRDVQLPRWQKGAASRIGGATHGTCTTLFLQYHVDQSCRRLSIQGDGEICSPSWWGNVKVTLQKSVWMEDTGAAIFEWIYIAPGKGMYHCRAERKLIPCLQRWTSRESPLADGLSPLSSLSICAPGLSSVSPIKTWLSYGFPLAGVIAFWSSSSSPGCLFNSYSSFRFLLRGPFSKKSFLIPPGWVSSFSQTLVGTFLLDQSLCQYCNDTSSHVVFIINICLLCKL